VDAGRITPLAAFAAYNAVPVAIYPFADALTNPDEPLSLYQKGQAVLQEGEAEEEIAQEATLVGGALVAGGTMSPAEHRAFVTLVDDQRLLEQLGTSPEDVVYHVGILGRSLGLGANKRQVERDRYSASDLIL